jgi:predicted NAD-dependent protein-ADP-ribosyltransferase YbiA (DUF1768 family)
MAPSSSPVASVTGNARKPIANRSSEVPMTPDQTEQSLTYSASNAAVFFRSREPNGGLSNMHGGFPLEVNGTRLRTSEVLYQVCRFPHLPEVQAEILAQRSPLCAKWPARKFGKFSREDFDSIKVDVMAWVLRVKLAQHHASFRAALLATGHLPIVERSRRDRVRFSLEGRMQEGRTNRIAQRATVLVEDSAGRAYSDGRHYAKFYVPLELLEPVPEPGPV